MTLTTKDIQLTTKSFFERNGFSESIKDLVIQGPIDICRLQDNNEEMSYYF